MLWTKWNAQDVFAGSARPLREEKEYDRAKLAMALEDCSVADQFTDTLRLSGRFVWMAGEKDAKFRALLDEMRKAGFPGSFFPVPDAGHRLLQDAPAAVAAALDQLIATR